MTAKHAPPALLFLVVAALGASASAAELCLPTPTGPHPVGTVSLHLVDQARPETLTDDPDDVRELMVQLWYPAAGTEGHEREPFLPSDERVLEATFGPRAANPMGIPPVTVEEKLRPLRSHSFVDAPLGGDGRLPVLIFSHGFGGFRTQNRFQTEELASHGWVVVAIDHTWCAGAVAFPDGRVALFAPGIDLRDRTLSNEARDAHMDLLAGVWARDALFVLDRLTVLDAAEEGRFAGRLDLERVGMFGHSFGGSAAGEAARLDPRIKAGINMDGMPYGGQAKEGFSQPFLFLRAERLPPDPTMLALGGMTEEEYVALFDEFDRRVRALASGSRAGYVAVLAGAKHFNFSDFPLFSELSSIAKMVVGELDPSLGVAIVNGYTRAFFERHLLGRDGELLDGEPPWPEVTFERFAARTASASPADNR